MPSLLNSQVFSMLILPILIFLIRIIDVSIGTIRIIFISRDLRVFAAILGFFEVLIWLFAIGQIMQNLSAPIYYIMYAAGFAMGTFVGITIERRLSYGNRIIQVITSKDATELVNILRKIGCRVTSIAGEGGTGPVRLIFTVVRRNEVSKVIKLIRESNPKAFYTVEDVRFVQDLEKDPLNKDRTLLRSIGSKFQKRK